MAKPVQAACENKGKSIKSSLSVNSVNKSNALSNAVKGSAAGLSILLITTIIFNPNSELLIVQILFEA